MGVLFEDWDSGPDEELAEKVAEKVAEEVRAEEHKKTEAEKQRADAAEARVRELEALLAAASQG